MGLNNKIFLWCADAPNQKALANKIQSTYGRAGMVIEQRKHSGKKKKKSIVSKAMDFFRFRSIHYAWHGLQYLYNKKYKDWPQVPTSYVESINSDEAYNF